MARGTFADALDQRVIVGLVEEHQREPARRPPTGALPTRWSVEIHRSFVHIIMRSPILTTKASSAGTTLDPLPGAALRLEPARHVLRLDDGQAAVIRVHAGTKLVRRSLDSAEKDN